MDPLEQLRQAMDRGAAQASSDLAAGRARIGGIWSQPDYIRSYLAASSILVKEARASDRLNELAVAITYQQRHVLELSLKALISMLHEIADNDVELAKRDGTTATSTQPSNGERKRLSEQHNLEILHRDLKDALKRECDAGASYEQLPSDLEGLVRDLSALEGGQASRLRYPTVHTKSGSERSFPDLIEIPVEQLQSRLERLVDEMLRDGGGGQIASLGQELAVVLHQQLVDIEYPGS